MFIVERYWNTLRMRQQATVVALIAAVTTAL